MDSTGAGALAGTPAAETGNAAQPSTFTRPMRNFRETYRLGAAYYPEWWDPFEWETDFWQMGDLGIRAARMGEFAWATFEPSPGTFRFDWMAGFSLAACVRSSTAAIAAHPARDDTAKEEAACTLESLQTILDPKEGVIVRNVPGAGGRAFFARANLMNPVYAFLLWLVCVPAVAWAMRADDPGSVERRLDQSGLEPRHREGLHELADEHVVQVVGNAPEEKQGGHQRDHTRAAGAESAGQKIRLHACGSV
jgi:hypothetical protein